MPDVDGGNKTGWVGGAAQPGSFAVKWQILAKSERRYQLSEVYLEDGYSMRIEM